MLQRLAGKPWPMLSAGLALGLVIGWLAAATFTTRQTNPNIQLPVTALHAAATHGESTMALATGPIDEGVEGVFILDFITGELQCSVLNPRTLQLGGLYKHNVVADLGVEQGKQPKYLMVTGAANIRTTGGAVRPAESIVYVADANTGNWVAYMLPWNRAAAQYNFAQVQRMVPIGKGSARSIQIEN